jgi:putative lipoic acid-binding regulatory protein
MSSNSKTLNFNNQEEVTERLKESFPAKINIRIVCQNQDNIKEKLVNFFSEKYKLTPKISLGNLSKTQKYATYITEADIATYEQMHDIFNQLAKLPFVVHII